ncbi:hypothetical protein GCM10007103_24500 [Salinimicrobium marinum]|uniref:Protein-glutamine gamma-glutamyltransferase-like C-terminal domain-containing protein n=1 Tax=Salinimicrobium marinum TaxID=680283 RepID=A0A918SGR7_9FLAO|nr:DUF4129 domain-containing protein [Salinimicrobium marinum]GHA42284.1 hypothetical protein GCM10007103_24500 [Salinimicrobium marinum]
MRILFIFMFLSFHGFSFTETVQDTTENEQIEIEVPAEASPSPSPLQFDREKLNSYKEQPEFDYTEEVAEENWWTKFKRYLQLQWQKFLNWLFGDHNPNSFVLFLLEILPYLILAGILGFAVWLFIKLNPGGAFLSNPKAGSVFLNEEEEIVQSRDIRKLIDEAVAGENYRLAVRYHYLLILQLLSQAGYIDYQFPKTDEEYLAEIEKEPLKNQFKKITRIYDFIWYGSFEVTRENYPKAEKEFQKMQQIINKRDEQNL